MGTQSDMLLLCRKALIYKMFFLTFILISTGSDIDQCLQLPLGKVSVVAALGSSLMQLKDKV